MGSPLQKLRKEAGYRTVREIAEACGFCNVAYLSNVFRRETGLSPRAWRTRG